MQKAAKNVKSNSFVRRLRIFERVNFGNLLPKQFLTKRGYKTNFLENEAPNEKTSFFFGTWNI